MSNENKQIYGGILKLSMPIVLQNLLSAMVSSADVIMLGSVGQSAISAVSLATQYSNVLYMILYGLGTGVVMLSAQYWGKHDLKAIQLIQGIALRFSIIISVLFAICAACIPTAMMRLFTNDPELIELGASYLRYVAASYLFWGFSEAYLACLRSVERVMASTLLNALAFSVNVFFNAVFIFGFFGAPKMGAAGVALATSISRAIQLLGCILVSAASKDVKLDPSKIFKRNPVLFKDFVKMALPALANDLVWSVAFSMYSAILGHLDSDIVAANSIIVVVRNFATVLCYGMANASTIWLGKEIGQNKLEHAEKDGKRFMILTVISALIGGALVLAVSPLVLRYANLSDQALHYLKYMLYINSYYIMGTAVNSTLIAGIFRAGGDSRFGFLCDTIDMWCYAIPLGLVSAFVLKLPPLWVYFLLCTDEFAKWPWVLRRYRSRRWLKNLTKEYD